MALTEDEIQKRLSEAALLNFNRHYNPVGAIGSHPQPHQNAVFNKSSLAEALEKLKEAKRKERLHLSSNLLVHLLHNPANSGKDPQALAIEAVTLADTLISTLETTAEVKERMSH